MSKRSEIENDKVLKLGLTYLLNLLSASVEDPTRPPAFQSSIELELGVVYPGTRPIARGAAGHFAPVRSATKRKVVQTLVQYHPPVLM